MNGENYVFLTEQVLPRLGFGGVLDDELFAKMKKGGDSIILNATGTFGSDQMKYDLELVKKDDRYYLNNISATISRENEDPQTHKFSLYAQNGYTADEMYNMMNKADGHLFVYREFMKEGERVGRWSTIDLTRKDDNDNGILRSYYDNTTHFNLVVELGKLPLQNLSRDDKEKLISEMKQGNPGMAVVKKPDGVKERVSLIAKPNIGVIEVRDKEGQKIKFEQNKGKISNNQKFTVKPGESEDAPKRNLTAAGKLLNAQEKTPDLSKKTKIG
ncbi:hypothetical protein [Chitinophaga cymbidii]|uniref:DUF3945 domain-containing protein n=1 Tax=Chitinophaga cymbidii TaxID=1096750 RepID=A0A512RFQ7_9BACT|nr:hypothetical protein [Chitinophaga cymbidii]GEP94531.1 hypothetical protein CCY01nite_07910 [Chitinophaga cymbidii]